MLFPSLGVSNRPARTDSDLKNTRGQIQFRILRAQDVTDSDSLTRIRPTRIRPEAIFGSVRPLDRQNSLSDSTQIN